MPHLENSAARVKILGDKIDAFEKQGIKDGITKAPSELYNQFNEALRNKWMKDQGFNTDAYHGTGYFKGDALKIRPGKPYTEFYSSADAKVASRYAETEEGNISQIIPLKLNTSDYHVFDGKGKPWYDVNHIAINQAQKLGKKGVTIKNVIDEPDLEEGMLPNQSHEPNTVHIALDPSTVRSSFAKFNPQNIGKNGLLLSDTSKPGMALSALENAPTFYSAVENAVNTASMKSAPAQQWLSTIANSKGVKPEELDWTGLKDYLGEQEGPVSKQQVQDYLQANKVQLQEVNKGVPIPQPDKQVFYKSNDNSNMMPVSSSESVINPKSGYREDVENGKASWIDENGNKLTTEEAGKRAKDWEDFHNA